MRKIFLLIALLFILLIGACSCSSQLKPDLQSVSKDVELFTAVNNISLKTGINIDDDTVLESVDFTSPKVMEPITADVFAVNIVELNEDNISDFVDKLEGKQQ